MRFLALMCCMLAATLSGPAHGLDTTYLADLLWQAKQRRDYLPDIYRLNPNVSEAELYAVQKKFVNYHLDKGGDDIAGFKGGFIPAAPVGGVLYKSGLLVDGATVELAAFKMLIVEAEIGFKFCREVSEPVEDVAELKTHVCALIPVIEIADGAIAQFGEVKKDFSHLRKMLISMNVASSHLLTGRERAADVELKTLPVSMSSNGELIGRRDVSKPGELWRNVLWVVNEFVLKQGYQIDRGQIVIPGNLTGIHPASAGEYVADFGHLGALKLTVK